MEYHIEVSARAHREAHEIRERIAEYAPRTAERWHRKLLEKIDSLRIMPERFSLAPEGESLGWELRQLLYGKRPNVYRILYVVHEDTVDVLSIWHSARGPAKF